MLRKLCLMILIISFGDLSTQKLIIDNDAGGDDAFAIFLALLYEKYFDGPKLIGLTTAYGNTNEDNVCLNNQRILKVAGRQDVPIYRGSKSSLVHTPLSVDNYYGKDGLGDGEHDDTGLVPEHDKNAVIALIEESKKHKGELIVVTIGTLTNVAMAIKLDPEFLSRIGHLYIGAGHIESERYNLPEFNAHIDPEAYYVVAQNATPDKVTILPFSQVKEFLTLSKTWRQEEFGAIDTDIVRAQNVYEKVSMSKNEFFQDLDPAVVAAVINPDLVEEYKYSKHGIILCGEKRGINTNEFTWRQEEFGAIDTDIVRAQNVYEKVSMSKNEFFQDLDPAVVAAVINPDLVEEYKYSKHGIILCGEKRGINTNEFVSKEEANVRIIYSLKREDYQKFLMDVFSADLQKKK